MFHPKIKTVALIICLLALTLCGRSANPSTTSAPYELVLNSELLVFEQGDLLSLNLSVRNLAKDNLDPHALLAGLTVVWDGTEYKPAAKTDKPADGHQLPAIYAEDALDWIGPKSVTTLGLKVPGTYAIPVPALTAGRHTVAVKDAVAASNALTVLIE
jgi:hypothetical protein